MADIPLRNYVQQLDNLIERKNVDEAIAHSRHILSFYPKHLDTYRMLGKALLEKGRHGDAADVFQRVLSVLPDDFIAHVGMAIVREDEANLEAALWHMERAFEAMPSNGAIQQELCRLYGRRDGVVPPKARLTRGALGRMYLLGALHLQAEAELKAALADDPERIDLQTVLAQVYWYAEQQEAAAQLCGAIVQQLPYSQVGNRILRQIFRSRGRDLDAGLYRQRLEALDPYEAHAPAPSDPATLTLADQVPPDKVLVTRLDYVAGMESAGGPDWIASIGARFEEPLARQGDATPDWLNTAESLQPVDAADLPGTAEVPDWLAAAAPAPARSGEAAQAVPDWLNELSEANAASAPTAAQADVPDWLQGATGALADEDVPDWMRAASGESEAPAPSGAIDETMPGWLAAAQKESAGADTVISRPAAAAEPEAAAPAADSDLPDWLKGAAPAPNLGDDLPDWLKATTGTLPDLPAWTSAAEADAEPSDAAPAEPMAAPWLAGAEGVDTLVPLVPTAEPPDAAQPEVAEAEAIPPAAAEAAPAEPTSDVPDWLADSTPAQPASELPDWLAAASETAPEAPAAAVAETAAPADDVPDWLAAAGVTATADLPEWMRSAPPEAEPSAEPIIGGPAPEADLPAAVAPEPPPATAPAPEPVLSEAAPPADTPVAEALPDWLQAAAPEQAMLTSASSLPAEFAADVPDWLAAAAATVPSDETPAWLQGAPVDQAATFGAAEGEALLADQPSGEPQAVAAPMDELPPWLGAAPSDMPAEGEVAPLTADAAAAEPFAAEAPPALETESEPVAAPSEVPDWLRDVSAASPAEEVPVWLQPSESALDAAVSEAPPPAVSEAPAPFDPIAAAAAAEALLPPVAEEPPAPEAAAPADLPDWLRAIIDDTEANRTAQWEAAADAEFGTVQPADVAEPADEEPEQPLPEGIPDWMQAMASTAPPPDAAAEATPEKLPVELPDYLQLASPEAIARAQQPFEPDEDDLEPVAADSDADVPAAIAPAELPDWLQALAPESPATTPAPAFDSDVMAAAAAGLNLDEAPDWLKAAQPDASSEAPDWLAAAQPAAPELPEDVDLSLEGAPAWLQEAAALPPAVSEAPPVAEAPAAPADELPDWLQSATELPAGDLPPWAQPEAPGPTDTVIHFLRAKEAPEQLKPLAPEPPIEAEPAAPVVVQEVPEAIVAEAERPVEAAAVAAEPSLDDMSPDEALRWLESLAARQGAPADELFMSQTTEAMVPQAVPEAPVPPVAEAPTAEPDTLDWLAQAEAAFEPDPLADTAPHKAAALSSLPEMPAEPEPAVAEAPPAEVTATPVSPAEALQWLEDQAVQPSAPAAAQGEPATEAAMPDIESMDAEQALAWLEKLAAQQGASADELLTAPEDRPAETPAWIAAEQAAAPSAAPDWLASLQPDEDAEPALEPAELPDWLKPPVDEVPAPEPTLAVAEPAADAAPDPASMDEDAALAWLESLALQQGASADEMITTPEARSAEAPAWVAAEQAAAEAETAATAEAPALAEVPDEPVPTLPAAEAVAAPEAPARPAEPELPAPPAAAEPAQETSTLQPDIDRLARLSDRLAASRRAREAEIEARFAQQRAEQEEARRLVWESMQAKRAAVESALETRPPAEPAAPEPQPEPAAEAPAPPVETSAPVAPLARTVTVPPPRADDSAWRPAVPPGRAPSPFAGHAPEAVLAAARARLDQQDEAAAADALDHLVGEDQMVDTVIETLEAAGSRESVPLLRVLGDAYARRQRLDDALAAYRHALRRL